LDPATLGIINTLSMFVAAATLLYLAAVTSGKLRTLSLLLGGFALMHGGFHLMFLLGQPVLAVEVVEPIAIVFLLAFSGYYWKRGLL
jgi:hypothetical protein